MSDADHSFYFAGQYTYVGAIMMYRNNRRTIVMYDIVIIGAGIVGTMLARDLSGYRLRLALVDRENDIANGATMANSAIIHTGYDPEDGTMKARMNVRGARMYEKICQDLGCLRKVVGAYVAACGEDEEKTLAVLKQRADERGIENVYLSGDEARSQEPNLGDEVTKVLSFPTTAVVYPWEIAIACAETAVNNGADLMLNTEVRDIARTENGYILHTDHGDIETRYVIDAAGTGAGKIARMVCEDPGFTIQPRKGEYFVLDHQVEYVKHIVFPVPGVKGKGVLAVPTVYGNTLLGPTSDPVQALDDTSTTFKGLDSVRADLNKTMKNVPYRYVIRNFAGLRPSGSTHDFVIRECEEAPGFIFAACVESPGLASAPAISEYIINEILSRSLTLEKDPDAVMTRKRPLVMAELTDEERAEVIRENPAYGRIICRCEQISEGEIVDAIHRTCGAHTVKGVKKRVRPGMGRCQGGFCEPRVLDILARELGVSPLDIVLDSKASRILESENR